MYTIKFCNKTLLVLTSSSSICGLFQGYILLLRLVWGFIAIAFVSSIMLEGIKSVSGLIILPSFLKRKKWPKESNIALCNALARYNCSGCCDSEKIQFANKVYQRVAIVLFHLNATFKNERI